MNTKRYLALDIGVTKIEAGVVTSEGEVLRTNRVRAQPRCSRAELLADLDAVRAPFADERLDGLGVGFPARGDYIRGVPCDEGSDYPEINGFPLRDHLSEVYSLPTAMTTDANMFALGVARFGEGHRFRDFIGLTVGTGIGVGVVLNGQLEQGESGVPAEALQALLQSTRRGYHLGRNFRRAYDCDGETLATRAAAGDSAALLAFESIGSALAETIRCLLSTPYPLQAIILGGGIAESYRFFQRAVERATAGTGIVIRPTALRHAALAGAAAMFSG